MQNAIRRSGQIWGRWALGLLLLGCNRQPAVSDDPGPLPIDASLPDDGSVPDGGTTDGGNPDAGTVDPNAVCTPTGFCYEYPSKFGITLNDVWAAAKDDAWAVGYRGAILHFNGSAWSVAQSPTRHTLYGIMGRSASDILAVGQGGTVVRYDGKRWSTVDLGTTADLYDVAMPADNDRWIAGDKLVLHNTGSTWQPVTPPYEPRARGYLHAVDSTHVWLVHGGIAQLWDGTRFTPVDLDLGTSGAVRSISGKTVDAVYACVDRDYFPVRKWDGSKFVLLRTPTAVGDLALNACAIEAAAPNDVWLFGDRGIGHFDGTTWSVVESSRQRTVLSAWSIGSDGIAVGWNGRVLVRSGAMWTVQNEGAGSDYTFASGLGAQAGVEWTALPGALLQRVGRGPWQRLPHDKMEVTSLLPTSATQTWATTTSSGPDAVMFWNGTRFESKAPELAAFWMNASWQNPDTGELLFGGKSGVVGYSGGTFTRLLTVPGLGWVQSVRGAPGADTWAVGDDGAAWRRRGTASFMPVTSGTTSDLSVVHVVSNSEVYIGGTSSTLLRYDGTAFFSRSLPALHNGSRNYLMVVDIDGELSSPRGLWVLVSGGEVIELHEGKAPIVHSLHFEGNQLKFVTPNQLLVIGFGNSVARKVL